MRRIVVTGATSFIGTHLIHKLIEENYFVYAIVRPNSKKRNLLEGIKNIQIIPLDMKEYYRMDQIIDTNCDIFFSLAWDGTRGEDRNDSNLQKKNYNNCMNGVNAALRLNCKKIISAGSQAEYGVQNGIISEKTICDPNTEYGKWKLQFYEDAFNYCRVKGVSFKEPRFFSVYGPGDYENSLIISTIKKMTHNNPCKFTECTWKWNYLYVEDAVEGMIKLLNQDCADGAYNLASNDTRPLKEFVLEMKSVLNSNSELRFGDLPTSVANAVSLEPDVRKMLYETGWGAKVDFAEGIRKTANYYK